MGLQMPHNITPSEQRMKDIVETYSKFCETKGISFQLDDTVCPYDNTTLFCPAGMQQFKKKFMVKLEDIAQNFIRKMLR